MSRKQQARDALRAAWPELLSESLEDALADAQNSAAAEAVARVLWPDLPSNEVVRLDRADPSFLLCGPVVPDCFDASLVATIAARAERRLQAAHNDNPYTRGAKLRQLIASEVEFRRAEIRSDVHALFDSRQSDRFCSAETVRERVLVHLVDLMLDELLRLCDGNDVEAKRRLKTLTALTTLSGDAKQRATRLQNIRDGSTASFPYVLKHLSRGVCPSVPSFPAGLDITLSGFGAAVESRFPEAVHVRICLVRYIQREGVITRFLDPDGPIAPGLEEQYASSPPYHLRPVSGLLVSKSAAITEYRRDELRVPDGIVCAVSLAVLLESLLRQTASALAIGAGVNARGWDLLNRVGPHVPLRARTVELLGTVFEQRSLNFKDAMAHGVFFASDQARLQSVLAGMSQALRCLVEDLAAAGKDTRVFGAPRWDAGRVLDNTAQATAQEQYQYRNLAFRLLPGLRWLRGWKLMRRITPDKAYMAQAASLLWVSGQEDVKRGRGDDTHHFAAMHAGLIVLEELFRAVYEIHGRQVLRVQREDADRVRCELSILDEQPGQLLDPSALGLVFGSWYEGDEFRRVLGAVRTVRDHVLHGTWQALQDPLHLYSHLITTMIYSLCDVVGFENERDADPGP